MSDFWLTILVIALIANAICMVQFALSVRRFNESRRQLEALLERLARS